MNSVTESEQQIDNQVQALQQEVEFLTGILDDIVKIYRGEYRGYADLQDCLQPYIDRKKPPEPEIKPWTRWRHEAGLEYILCLIRGKYQLNDYDGGGQWSTGPYSTPLEAFYGQFDQFTQVTEGES